MEKDKTDKKDHILNIAEKIFSDQGFDGASTRMISGEAGVNMAMLNYYFGSKEGLFLAVINRKIYSFLDNLQSMSSIKTLSSWQKLEYYIELYSSKIVSNNCFQKLIYHEMGINRRNEMTENIRRLLMINIDELRKILKEGILSGDFRNDADIEMVIATLYGTQHYIVSKPMMSAALLGYDLQDEPVLEEQFKPRIKSYLKNLLRSYLINNDCTIRYTT